MTGDLLGDLYFYKRCLIESSRLAHSLGFRYYLPSLPGLGSGITGADFLWRSIVLFAAGRMSSAKWVFLRLSAFLGSVIAAAFVALFSRIGRCPGFVIKLLESLPFCTVNDWSWLRLEDVMLSDLNELCSDRSCRSKFYAFACFFSLASIASTDLRFGFYSSSFSSSSS